MPDVSNHNLTWTYMYFRYIYTKECCVKQVTFEILSLLYKDFYFSDVKHIIIRIWEFMDLKVNIL